jgi:hypothetical protein
VEEQVKNLPKLCGGDKKSPARAMLWQGFFEVKNLLAIS